MGGSKFERAATGGKGLERRRLPRQDRAKETVAAILQATEQLVAAQGFTDVNTRMIAAKAGVSVGSLYQYFPTYESILLIWYERVSTDASQKIRAATLDAIDVPLEQSVPKSIAILLNIYLGERLALIDMPRYVPKIERIIEFTSFEALNRNNIRLYLSQHPEFDTEMIGFHADFISLLVTQILRKVVVDNDDAKTCRKYARELAGLIISYLQRHRVA